MKSLSGITSRQHINEGVEPNKWAYVSELGVVRLSWHAFKMPFNFSE